MHLQRLAFTVLVIFQVREILTDSVYWKEFTVDLTTVDDGYKTQFSVTSAVLCASLAAMRSSCVFCFTGTSCVALSATPSELYGVTNGVGSQCYYTGKEQAVYEFLFA